MTWGDADALPTGEPTERGRHRPGDGTGPGVAGTVGQASSARSVAPTRQRLLRNLLIRHRQQLSRADVGLPTRRWHPGNKRLSQEDLAQLTGLGIGVIQRLEAGTGHPDMSALDAVAAALHMDAECRQALYYLSRRHPPPPLTFANPSDPGLDEVVKHFHGPALVVDALFTVLSRNDHARRWLPGCGDSEPNLARWLVHPLATPLIEDWSELAAMIMTQLRQLEVRFPNNAQIVQLLGDLRRHTALDQVWRRDEHCYHSAAAIPLQIRAPGQPDHSPVRESALLVALRSLRPDDGRTVIALVIAEPAVSRAHAA